MTSIAIRRSAAHRPVEARESWLIRTMGPAWPLKALLLGLPLWWALGLASFVFFIAAAIMAVQMVRRGPIRVPSGFGLWVLFLIWMLAGVFLLWAHAPGTIDGGGLERLVGFAVRVLWYVAITIAMLYPMNLPPRAVTPEDVARWLGWAFLVCVAGGLAGLIVPDFQFTTLAEMIIPGARGQGFIHTMVHASLTTGSDFLGYVQPRPKAPFAYANTWGNNIGLLLPFFLYSWMTSPKRWRRYAAPLIVLVAAAPIIFSLNRGLWVGLVFLAVYASVVLARSGHVGVLWGLVVALLVSAMLLVASPLWDTITLRLETPNSNDRRGTLAEVVTTTTLKGSPFLGYGTTRQVTGSFASVAGGETPNCHQCAAPPLGTQGFIWRLIFTTGFVGTALFFSFLIIQWFSHVRRRDPFSVLGCMSIAVSVLFFFVYDSLESPLFLLMLTIGLMNVQRPVAIEATDHVSRGPRVMVGSRS